MSDKLILEEGQAQLLTDEGRQVTLPEEKLVEMLRSEIEPPLDGVALPDGVKFLRWRRPFLCVVHQFPAHVRQLRWITADSPVPFGPGAQFQMRRLSIPYAITFATYCQHAGRLDADRLQRTVLPQRAAEDPRRRPGLPCPAQRVANRRGRTVPSVDLHATPRL